ncbi:WhiB family transcriptional regulator [Amycolatopsis magusensis]|uniref:WhiB family transcriptional regulator n=1 Tax=Amycolatopsis magusensis TaxID=882444 RepID=UPI003C2D9A91
MITCEDDFWLIAIAWRLDRLRWVPASALNVVVTGQGLCMWPPPDAGPPSGGSDRELAARLCEGCSVLDECLELELRVGGDTTLGVWGGLAEDDRRALRPHWLRRGERARDGGAL